MRFCMPTAVSLDVTTHEDANGRLIYKLTGPSTGSYVEFIDIVDRLFYNRTYYLTSDVEECGVRLRQNLSDVETSYFSYYKNLTYYTVPVPVVISKTAMITGYNVTSTRSRDSATLMGNFAILELPVYLWCMFLILLIALVIASRVLLHLRVRRILSRRRKRFILLQRSKRTQNIFLSNWIARKVIKQVTSTLQGSSEFSRLAGLLYTLLSFFVITGFLCMYSTSKIIVEEPFVVKSYQELLDTERSFPMFYELVSKISYQFRDAPVGSVKHRVWLKLQERTKKPSDYIFDRTTQNPHETMLRLIINFEKDKAVTMASSLISNMLKTFACGSSPDGSSGGSEEFWRIVVLYDPSEGEDIFGWALSRKLKENKTFTRKVSRLFYSGILLDFFKKQTDGSNFASTLAGTSSRHLHKAMMICSDDYKMDTGEPLKAVALGYYSLFFKIYVFIPVTSLFILTLEFAHKTCTTKRLAASVTLRSAVNMNN